ncbi:MAG: C69 family dipeptidase, partial [Candidatus Neomarinimicrobiota bacterium]
MNSFFREGFNADMCDTFVVLPSASANVSTLFGKNSDREPNEAQIVEYHPAADHPADSRLKCSYLEIPQVRHTCAVLLSRPFWMWGAEIGANEHGVVIGNEAVWSKMPLEKVGRLTGMDLLRLALERSTTAETALEKITELLAEFGQGGNCGYTAPMVYHNSYIIADPAQAWVLETAGQLWVARRINNSYSISNGLTIGEEFDLSHSDLITVARRKGWLKKGAAFDFAECYADWFYTTFSGCRSRQRRSRHLVAHQKPLDLPAAMAILRDHGDEDYRPDSHFLINRICAHSANPVARHSAQST